MGRQYRSLECPNLYVSAARFWAASVSPTDAVIEFAMDSGLSDPASFMPGDHETEENKHFGRSRRKCSGLGTTA